VTALRRTLATRAVVDVLLGHDGEIHAYAIGKAADLDSGVVVPILHRLEAAGLVTPRPDPGKNINGGRRRYYRLTDTGRTYLTEWRDARPNGARQ
jgi:PadR family transcriptional regulator PadR